MRVESGNWQDLHPNTKRKLFKLMRKNASGMRAAVEYHDHHNSHVNCSTAVARNVNGRIVGWAYTCPYLDRGMYVMVYVDPDHRKKGYGTTIVQELMKAHQAANGSQVFHACCIETRFFSRAGIKNLSGKLPVRVSWRDEERKAAAIPG